MSLYILQQYHFVFKLVSAILVYILLNLYQHLRDSIVMKINTVTTT